MKIATWNINSIKTRLTHVLKWCESAKPDVVCLQETKIVDDKFPLTKFQAMGYEYAALNGQRTYHGVAILSKYELDNIQKGFPKDVPDAQARLIAATVRGIRVVNVYVPHGRRIGHEMFDYKMEWIARLRKFFDKSYKTSELVLLCGDFNITPHEMDLWNIKIWINKLHFTKPEREIIQKLKKWGFVDVFRMMNDSPDEYTWWDYFHPHSVSWNKGLRLDHIWASQPLADLCTDCWVDREPRTWDHASDHAPVVAEFRL